jgi:hypothetical protein
MKTRSSPKLLRASFGEAGSLRAPPVVPGDAHALAAAAGRGLDHHRIADLRRSSPPLGVGSITPM